MAMRNSAARIDEAALSFGNRPTVILKARRLPLGNMADYKILPKHAAKFIKGIEAQAPESREAEHPNTMRYSELRPLIQLDVAEIGERERKMLARSTSPEIMHAILAAIAFTEAMRAGPVIGMERTLTEAYEENRVRDHARLNPALPPAAAARATPVGPTVSTNPASVGSTAGGVALPALMRRQPEGRFPTRPQS